MADKPRLKLPQVDHHNEREHRRQLADAIADIANGKINSVGSVTLNANQTTTAIDDRRIGTDSVIILVPRTENAAGVLAQPWISALTKFQATITHQNDASTDRTFDYVVLG